MSGALSWSSAGEKKRLCGDCSFALHLDQWVGFLQQSLRIGSGRNCINKGLGGVCVCVCVCVCVMGSLRMRLFLSLLRTLGS